MSRVAQFWAKSELCNTAGAGNARGMRDQMSYLSKDEDVKLERSERYFGIELDEEARERLIGERRFQQAFCETVWRCWLPKTVAELRAGRLPGRTCAMHIYWPHPAMPAAWMVICWLSGSILQTAPCAPFQLGRALCSDPNTI